MKSQKRFWRKLTKMVIFTRRSFIFPIPSNPLKTSSSTFGFWTHISGVSFKKENTSPEENSVLRSTVCTIFSKLLIKLASVYKFPYGNPKLRGDLQNQKTLCLLKVVNLSSNIQIDKLVFRFVLERDKSLVFSVKKFDLHGNQYILYRNRLDFNFEKCENYFNLKSDTL